MRLPLRDAMLLVGVTLLAFALRWYALSGEMGPDSTVYAQYAWNVLQGDFTLGSPDQYTHRLPVFVPVSLFYALAGVGRVTTAAWPMLLSLAQVVAAFLLGRKLFGPATGVFAGLLLASFPLDAIEAGRLMPDVIMGSLIGISGAVWMASPDRSTRWTGLASGLLLTLATAVRPYALLMLPLFVADSLVQPRLRRRLPWVGLGVLAMAAPVTAAYALTTGDPFYRAGVISAVYASGVLAEGAGLYYYPRLIWTPWHPTGLHPLLLSGSVLICLIGGPGRERVRLLAWIAAFLGFLQFGSMSLSEWVPILKRIRFLTPVSLPASVLAGSVVAGVAGWTAERRWWTSARGRLRTALRAGALIVLAGLLALCIWRIDLDRSSRVPRYEAFEAVALRVAGADPIIVDHWRTAIRLAYHLEFTSGAHYYRNDDRARMDRDRQHPDARLGYLRWYPDSNDVPQSWVLIDEETLAGLRRFAGEGRTFAESDVPAWALDPPPDWSLEFEGAGLRLYRVGGQLR
jgi:4-amino-4-deoxy-L-arabinose transferase-like glycosyltransferase